MNLSIFIFERTIEWWHGGVEHPERSELGSLSAVATHGFTLVFDERLRFPEDGRVEFLELHLVERLKPSVSFPKENNTLREINSGCESWIKIAIHPKLVESGESRLRIDAACHNLGANPSLQPLTLAICIRQVDALFCRCTAK